MQEIVYIYRYQKSLSIEDNSRLFLHFRKFKNLEDNKEWIKVRVPLNRVVLQRTKTKNFPNANLINNNNHLDNQINNLLLLD